ncbi:MAG: hypothetical protein K0R69_1984 [Clostridia bacterium]|jgi:hypothetical protein|nr:hypothetical protein [Clostridia bacterium]
MLHIYYNIENVLFKGEICEERLRGDKLCLEL